MSRIRRAIDHPAFRFLVAGTVNSIATAAIVAMLSFVMAGWLAFTIAFSLGLAVAVVVNGRWVFQSHITIGRVLASIAGYVLVYGLGVALVLVIEASPLPTWANGGTVLVTAPLSYLIGRRVFPRPESEVQS